MTLRVNRRRFVSFIVLLFTSSTALTGCSTMKPETFQDSEPKLVLEDFFQGRTKAWGLFHDRFGTLRRQFEVDIEGTWDGRNLTLVEDFIYDDGEIEQRIWRIEKLNDHTYRGEADGVIGSAEGKAFGKVVNWTYRFALNTGDSNWNVNFDDWFYLQSQNVMINRAEVTKFGFTIGEVTLVFVKASEDRRFGELPPTFAAQ